MFYLNGEDKNSSFGEDILAKISQEIEAEQLVTV